MWNKSGILGEDGFILGLYLTWERWLFRGLRWGDRVEPCWGLAHPRHHWSSPISCSLTDGHSLSICVKAESLWGNEA